MTENFIFQKEWYDVLKNLPPKSQNAVYSAVMEFVFYEVEPQLANNSMEYIAFCFIKNAIMKSKDKYEEVKQRRIEAGRRAAEKRWKEQNGQTGGQPEPNCNAAGTEQTETEDRTEPEKPEQNNDAKNGSPINRIAKMGQGSKNSSRVELSRVELSSGGYPACAGETAPTAPTNPLNLNFSPQSDQQSEQPASQNDQDTYFAAPPEQQPNSMQPSDSQQTGCSAAQFLALWNTYQFVRCTKAPAGVTDHTESELRFVLDYCKQKQTLNGAKGRKMDATWFVNHFWELQAEASSSATSQCEIIPYRDFVRRFNTTDKPGYCRLKQRDQNGATQFALTADAQRAGLEIEKIY